MKLKNLVKKGGVADIVTLMVIIGLVIALIIAIVIPMVNNSREKGEEAYTSQEEIDGEISALSVRVDGQ